MISQLYLKKYKEIENKNIILPIEPTKEETTTSVNIILSTHPRAKNKLCEYAPPKEYLSTYNYTCLSCGKQKSLSVKENVECDHCGYKVMKKANTQKKIFIRAV